MFSPRILRRSSGDRSAPRSRPTEAVIEELYLTTLCRPPSTRERARTLELVKRAKTPRAGLEDVLWGLLNAKEFLLRQ